MSKKKLNLDEEIVTIEDFLHAVQSITPKAQMFVQDCSPNGDDTALIEITEIMVRLPKKPDETPYLILRCYQKGEIPMKIKTQFVTNSSSVSFVVMGAYIEAKEIPDEKLQIPTALEAHPTLADARQYIGDYLDELVEGTDLAFSHGDPNGYSDNFMIGIIYEAMDEEETLREFKARAHNQILEALGVDKDVGHIQASWEDR